MLAIDQVRQAFTGRRRSITVPEWGDLELFFTPVTQADIDEADARMEDEDGGATRSLVLLVQKAQLEDGSRAFRWGDMHTLRNEAEWTVLQRVAGFMLRSSFMGMDEAKKESEVPPASDSD